jgi:hypothetical protein
MPPEAPVAQPSPTAADPKATAANIAKGAQDKAQGKAPAADPKAAPAAGKPVEGQDPNAGKRKYVVEGKERWLSPTEADAYVQKGLAFEPKISELARMRQEINQFEQALINNPGAVIANIAKKRNIPIGDMVKNVLQSNASDEVKEATGRWFYENVAKRQMMDPKDRELLEKDERIRSLEERDKNVADQAAFAENRNKVVAALATVSGQIKETLAELGIKNVDSPMALRLTKDIADVMRISYFSRQPCTAKQAADKVRQRIHDFQGQFYGELDAETLVERLGKENVEKIRAHLLKPVLDAEKGTKQHATQQPSVPKRNQRETMNMDDFHDYLDGIKKTNSLQK